MAKSLPTLVTHLKVNLLSIIKAGEKIIVFMTTRINCLILLTVFKQKPTLNFSL